MFKIKKKTLNVPMDIAHIGAEGGVFWNLGDPLLRIPRNSIIPQSWMK